MIKIIYIVLMRKNNKNNVVNEATKWKIHRENFMSQADL
jgi:hypothetical protein